MKKSPFLVFWDPHSVPSRSDAIVFPRIFKDRLLNRVFELFFPWVKKFSIDISITINYFGLDSFAQHKGIYVIPNVRWGDERTFTMVELPEPVAFVGIPQKSIVSIGTYGCCKTKDEKRLMHLGIVEMLKKLTPQVVVVYGSMPSDVFCGLPECVKFLQFDNWTREVHMRSR